MIDSQHTGFLRHYVLVTCVGYIFCAQEGTNYTWPPIMFFFFFFSQLISGDWARD